MSHQILMKHFPTFIDWNAPAAWAVHCTKLVFQSSHFQSKEKPLGFLIKKIHLYEYDVVCSVVVKKSAQSSSKKSAQSSSKIKKPLHLLHQCMFCFGHIGVPMYKRIWNFFFNSKICYKFVGILLHTHDFSTVDILNFMSYSIGFGRTMASLPTMKLQSQVIFFQVLIFVS